MLDSAGYLTSFGWQGQGNGLRRDAISRPLAIPQKRTLTGLGKDRDEAFPFWDHLFTAAAKSIKINVSGSNDDTNTVAHDGTIPSDSPFLRTVTGILSNRRPVAGTPATSGSATPDETDPHHPPRLSLMAMANRESARRRLYAGFFRGPVLGSEVDPYDTTQSSSNISGQTKAVLVTNDNGNVDGKKRRHEDGDLENSVKKPKRSKKIKQSDTCSDMIVVKERRKRSNSEETKDIQKEMSLASFREESTEAHEEKRLERRKRKEERRQRKAAKLEKRRSKEERRQRKAANLERRTRKEERRKSPEDTHD